ncbi:chitin disaccharide deacetylase [Desnuesiella massiliensis]|uniref:chitin disaccharide deacetylase n=1 Tax=Desnuesiella massiliensis TaxID=1650662 RepID=UPI0006E1B480|nr:chitin disaccharide deacetylase [Desnuesiella massiliensis]
MKLIINADDFGLTKGISLGILDSMEKGIVTETTAMPNGLYFEEAIREAKNRGIYNIGVHLTLTWGKPILPVEQVSSLVDDKGNFIRLGKAHSYEYEEVKRELNAQMEKFLSTGLNPTHIDGHHHFFAFEKEILDIVIDIAKEYELPLRCASAEHKKYYSIREVKTTEAFSSDFYASNVSYDYLVDLISKYRDVDSFEIMTHPAYVDEEVLSISSYNSFREKEFHILTSSEIKDFINRSEVQLIGFKDL